MANQDDIALEEQFAQKRMSASTFRRLARYVAPYRRKFALNLVFTILATISQLAGPKFIQLGIDRYLTNFPNAAAALRGIGIISAIYLGNLVLNWFLSVIQVRSAIAIGHGALEDLRLDVFRHIQRLSLNYFDRTHQGRIISRADTDIGSLERIMTWGANQMLASILTLVGVLALMVQYDWHLCLAVSVVLPPLWLATRLFHKIGMRAYRGVREQASRLTASLAENIAGVRVVQAFSREEENLANFGKLQDVYFDRFLASARVFHTYMPFLGMISGIGTAIVLGYGGYLVMHNQITVGELAAFILYLSMFFGPIQTMGDLYNAVLSSAASAERIFDLLDTQPQVQNKPGAEPLPPIRGHVSFEGVYFRYDSTPADTWVLKNISFEARPGETVALVGHTGSGKTSIISLITRFYEPQKGKILIDGLDLLSATVESLHEQIAIVTQENFLFTGTVMENLKFGRPTAADEEVIGAAKTLGIHEFIERLSEGYQTKVGERGGNLSAGERQLLTFTRAMVAQPRILILDEATSAVDTTTEKAIQHALEELFARRTCFVVAHRLSTVRNAHRIIVLKDGEIVEMGRHEDLLAAAGPYASLHKEFVRH